MSRSRCYKRNDAEKDEKNSEDERKFCHVGLDHGAIRASSQSARNVCHCGYSGTASIVAGCSADCAMRRFAVIAAFDGRRTFHARPVISKPLMKYQAMSICHQARPCRADV